MRNNIPSYALITFLGIRAVLMPAYFDLFLPSTYALITDPRGTGDVAMAPLASSLRFWLDSSDATTLYSDASCTTPAVDGGTVSCWQDKSGNNSHAITLTGSYSPTYRASDSLFGTPVVDFTSANALLADPIDWSGAYTLFIVLASDTPTPVTNDAFFSSVSDVGTVGGLQIDYQNGTDNRFRAKIRNNFTTLSDGFGDFEHNVSKLYALNSNGSGAIPKLYSEGADISGTGFLGGNIPDGVFEQYRINVSRNSNNFHDSRIAEVIIYDKSLDSCEMANVNIYLGEKYGRDFAGMSANYDEFTATHSGAPAGVGIIPSSCSSPIVYDHKRSAEVSFRISAPYDVNHDLDIVNQDEFMTFAHDNTPLAIVPVDFGPYDSQMSRTWRVDVDDATVDTVADMSGYAIRDVEVSFDLTELIASGQTVVPTDLSQYALLIDRDNDGDFSDADHVTSGLSLSGNSIIVSGVDFLDGNRFALVASRDDDITVTVEQVALQTDPTGLDSARFRVLFDTEILPASFTAGDITLSGTTGIVSTPVQVLSSNNTYNGTTYEFEVTGMTSGDTVTVSLPVSRVTNAASVANKVSTSLDNSVTYDATPPVITLIGSGSLTLSGGVGYIDAGALWTDAVDGTGPLTTTGTVDTNTPGIYTLSYTHTDRAGNTATAIRSVTVLAIPTPPTPPSTPSTPVSGPGGGGGGGGGGSSVTSSTSITISPDIILQQSPLLNNAVDTLVDSVDDTLMPLQSAPSESLLSNQIYATAYAQTPDADIVLKLDTDSLLSENLCHNIVQVYTPDELQTLDIPSTEYREDIQAMLMYRAYVSGEAAISESTEGVFRNDNSVDPFRSITRAEFVKMLIRSLSCHYISLGVDSGFSDVSSTSWYAEYITYAHDQGWINGYSDGTFRPNAPISRAEAAKILSLAITLDIEKSMNAEYLDVPVNHTLQSYIHTLTKNGVMVGGSSGKFFPDNTLTRAEIARIFYKTFFGGTR